VERRLVVSGEVALLKKFQPLMHFLRLVADRDKALNQLLLRVGEALRQDVTVSHHFEGDGRFRRGSMYMP
jgi:hypothetical protein